MTLEEEQKICLNAEKEFKRGNLDRAYEILQPVLKENENNNRPLDEFTAILLCDILTKQDREFEIAKHMINQLSQTNNLKIYIRTIKAGAQLEKNKNGKDAAYSFISSMRKAWLDRDNSFIPSYYESHFSIMLADYTTNNNEREELLKSVIEKGYKESVKYEKPNDVYVKASKELVKTYLYDSKFDDAIKVCDKYLEKFTDDYYMLYHKARACVGINKDEEAKETLSKIDVSIIKDKKMLEKIESLKGSIEKNSTTIEEIKENYFGEISFKYAKGEIITPAEKKEPTKKRGTIKRRKKTKTRSNTRDDYRIY